jgi:hypothetical protein
MTTPICDFVKKYYESDPVRMHMPGHKGRTVLGPERLDITEIEGAGVLYAKPPFPAEAAADRRDSPGRRESSPQDIIRESKGSAPQDIIRESEENAALIFGTAKTLYSAEGSSL